MNNLLLAGVELTPLKKICSENGSVLHGLKKSEQSYRSFGEAYFSTVKKGVIKGWKRHNVMISNLVVPQGKVVFYLYDDRNESYTKGHSSEIILGANEYSRLTIPNGLWFAFKGIHTGESLILNIASIEHDPYECDLREINDNRMPSLTNE